MEKITAHIWSGRGLGLNGRVGGRFLSKPAKIQLLPGVERQWPCISIWCPWKFAHGNSVCSGWQWQLLELAFVKPEVWHCRPFLFRHLRRAFQALKLWGLVHTRLAAKSRLLHAFRRCFLWHAGLGSLGWLWWSFCLEEIKLQGRLLHLRWPARVCFRLCRLQSSGLSLKGFTGKQWLLGFQILSFCLQGLSGDRGLWSARFGLHARVWWLWSYCRLKVLCLLLQSFPRKRWHTSNWLHLFWYFRLLRDPCVFTDCGFGFNGCGGGLIELTGLQLKCFQLQTLGWKRGLTWRSWLQSLSLFLQSSSWQWWLGRFGSRFGLIWPLSSRPCWIRLIAAS